jgi:hypothetical protein
MIRGRIFLGRRRLRNLSVPGRPNSFTNFEIDTGFLEFAAAWGRSSSSQRGSARHLPGRIETPTVISTGCDEYLQSGLLQNLSPDDIHV